MSDIQVKRPVMRVASKFHSAAVRDPLITPELNRLLIQKRLSDAQIAHARNCGRKFATVCMFRAKFNIDLALEMIGLRSWGYRMIVTKWQVNRYHYAEAMKSAKLALLQRKLDGMNGLVQ